MAAGRKTVVFSLLKGLFAAVVWTLLWMLIAAVITLFWRLSDGALIAVNQILKITSILLGVILSVGRGGSRGFATGAVLAMLYMIIGYSMYVLLGGGAFLWSGILGEILIGAAIGGLSGAILANLQPSDRRKKRRR